MCFPGCHRLRLFRGTSGVSKLRADAEKDMTVCFSDFRWLFFSLKNEEFHGFPIRFSQKKDNSWDNGNLLGFEGDVWGFNGMAGTSILQRDHHGRFILHHRHRMSQDHG